MAETTNAPEGSEAEVQGPKPEDVVARWMKELDAADRHEKPWREQASKIITLYKDERKRAEEDNSAQKRFNILYANTEVMKGALYSRCPTPDIRRRWLDRDPVGRVSALILTRCVTTAIDQADLHGTMKQCVFDMVVPGRAQARVRYCPTIACYENRVEVPDLAEGATLPDGVQFDDQGYFRMEEVEDVTHECVEIDYVEWDMFRMSPAKHPKKLRWMAYGELLTRDDLIAQFGDIGKEVELKWKAKGSEKDTEKEEEEVFKRALVWTIYNKTQRKCIVVSDGYKKGPLKEVDDPLKLEAFFPSPAPLYAISTTDSMVPVPEYTVYQDHALELDALQERISVLTDALRRRGVFDATFEELRALAGAAKDNDFVAIKDWKKFSEKGGLSAAIEEMDISGLATVIIELTKQAEIKKQQIYEIIGISDIMRGATKATETLGAQQIKDQWGSVRVGPRQDEVSRFARDVIRLAAEIIAEHFSPKTMQAMSGIELAMDDAEKQAIAAMDPQGQDPRLKRPTWEQVLKVLRSDKLRGFKVGIETDSTIKPKADQEQKNRVDLITAVTGYLEKALPAIQQGMLPKKVGSELLMFAVRAFPAGAQLEEMLDEWASGGVDEMMQGGPGQQPGAQGGPQAAQEAMAQQEMQKQAAHADALRQIEVETKQADAARAKAQAHEAIAKARIAEPIAELDLIQAQLATKKAAEPTPPKGGAPAGATLQ